MQRPETSRFKDGLGPYLRSALHPDGTDVVQAALLDVAALGGELLAAALEVLLLEHGHLRPQRKTFSPRHCGVPGIEPPAAGFTYILAIDLNLQH